MLLPVSQIHLHLPHSAWGLSDAYGVAYVHADCRLHEPNPHATRVETRAREFDEMSITTVLGAYNRCIIRITYERQSR